MEKKANITKNKEKKRESDIATHLAIVAMQTHLLLVSVF